MADSIMTEYADESNNEFIHCELCDKLIRGDTQFKIHQTTSQHMKKEEAIKGLDNLPVWNNFSEYLDYLNLDEPIIGLGYLEQTSSQVLGNGRLRLQYKCKLCNQDADMPGMANHVVGRKHRQKLLEMKRPDLVTWESFSSNQQGRVIRAKAEVVERQEGRGKPKEMNPSHKISKWMGPQKGNTAPISTFQTQRQNPQEGLSSQRIQEYGSGGMGFPEFTHHRPVSNVDSENHRLAYPEDSPLQPGYADQSRFMVRVTKRIDYGHEQLKDAHPEVIYVDGISGRSFDDDPPRQVYYYDNPHQSSYHEDVRQEHLQPGNGRAKLPYPEGCQQSYLDDAPGQATEDHGHRHRPSERLHSRMPPEEPSSQHRDAENYGREMYAERGPSGRPYSHLDHHLPVQGGNDQTFNEVDAFVRRAKEESKQGSEDLYDGSYTKGSDSGWYPKEDTDRRFQDLVPADNSKERYFSSLEANGRNKDVMSHSQGFSESVWERDWVGDGEPFQPSSEAMSRPQDYPQHPEAAYRETPNKKRRTRFSDCTDAEMESLQKMQKAKAVAERITSPPYVNTQKSTRSFQQRTDQLDPGRALQGSSSNVLGVLDGVQIENEDEANFLKSKLCSLLKEFQANKSDKRGERTPSKDLPNFGYLRGEIQGLSSPSDDYSQRRGMSAAREEFHLTSSERDNRKSYEREKPYGRDQHYDREQPLYRDNEQPMHPDDLSMRRDERPMHPDDLAMRRDERPMHPDDQAMRRDERHMHPDDLAMRRDERHMHPDDLAMRRGERPMHPDDLAMHRGERPMHPDDLAMRRGERPMHPDDLGMRRGERPMHPDDLGMRHGERPMHPDDLSMRRDERPMHPDELRIRRDRALHPDDLAMRRDERHTHPDELRIRHDWALHPDDLAMLQDEQLMHQNERRMYRGERPMHPDELLMHPDERRMHPDERRMHPDERRMHPDERRMHPDERPMHPDGWPMYPDGRPMHPDGRPRHPDEFSRSQEKYDDYLRDDIHGGAHRATPQDGFLGFGQEPWDPRYDHPPRDFPPHLGQPDPDGNRPKTSSSLNKIASTLLQLVANK